MLVCHLKRILLKRNVTQTKVSEDTKIRPQCITDLCNNSFVYINLQTVDTLCKYLNCRPEELFESKIGG